MTPSSFESRRLRTVIGSAAVALLLAGLLFPRANAPDDLGSSSTTLSPSTHPTPSDFVASGALVPDSDPSLPRAAQVFGDAKDTRKADKWAATF